MLPCADIDSIRDFYLPMGFKVTYRQLRPNPYLALQREGVDLHYFGMPDLKTEDSYSTCGIVVTDTRPLFDAFAEGLTAVRQTADVGHPPDHPPPEAQERREPGRIQPCRPRR